MPLRIETRREIKKLKSIVAGTAINIFIAGIVTFFHRVLFGVPLLPLTIEPFKTMPIPLLSRISIVGPILFSQSLLTYAAYIVAPLGFFVLFKTSAGLVVRSTGENPESVDVAGINVERVRTRYTLYQRAIAFSIAQVLSSILRLV
jgi:simple sugar transport system permease protein